MLLGSWRPSIVLDADGSHGSFFFFFLVPSGARSSPPLVDGVVRLGLEMATRSRSPLCAALLLSTKSAGGGGSLASRACVMVLLGRKVFVRCGSDGTEGMGLGWRWAKKGKKGSRQIGVGEDGKGLSCRVFRVGPFGRFLPWLCERFQGSGVLSCE
jgi:hypothetical protein